MNRAEYIEHLTANIANCVACLEAASQALDKDKKNKSLAARVDGLRAALIREETELEVAQAVPSLTDVDALKEVLREQMAVIRLREQAVAELREEGVIVE